MGQFFYLGVPLAPCKHSARVGVTLSLHKIVNAKKLLQVFAIFLDAFPILQAPTIPNVCSRRLLRRFRSLPSFCKAKTRERFISETTMEVLLKNVYSNFMQSTAHPFVKWAGGKTQLLPEIRKHYPHQIKKYCEPFVGGGAVLFDVLQKCHPEEVLINDVNAELINTYLQIKNNCNLLIEQISEIQQEYKNQTLEENKILFYEKRNRYNELKVNGNDAENLEKAALFIFLNKTCFNGLYRVNKKGEFNVPFNNAKNPLICDEENLKSCSEFLQNVQMKVGDYSNCKNFIDSETFVYLDPPYRPLTQTSAFTSYSENNFSDKEQIELRNFISEISNKGAKVLASNSDPKNANKEDNFFDELYSNFSIERIRASRMINSNAKRRGAISELLISNIASVF